MRNVFLIFTFAFCFSIFAQISPAIAATYYIRTDGGDASQCTGRTDAAYSGSGTGQACAWKNPSFALPSSGSRIAGGDTLFIGSGTYLIGSVMAAIPSGSSSAFTRVLGNSGAVPKLVGVNGISRLLDLSGSSYVEVGHLEVTDNSDCVVKHSNSIAACVPGGPYAHTGLYAADSRNVWLHDLNIHGFGHTGLTAGRIADWTLDRVKLNKNGRSGWGGSIGSSSSNSGYINLRHVELGWNGCGERVSTGEPWACWAQQTGGYGDGLGTYYTGGKWLIEDSYIHHNTSDGLDLLYMNGADSSSVTLRRVLSVANAGNQIKVTGNALIENSIIIGHCQFFKNKYFMVDGDHCRAYGASVQLAPSGNDIIIMRHNTLAGEGDALITYTNTGDASDKIYIQNNVGVGFPYFKDGSSRSFTAGSAPAAKYFSGNLGWDVGACPSGSICNTQNPKLTNMTLASFDALPLSDSPVIDKAPLISAVTSDYRNLPRPSGAAADIGAFEIQFGTSPPAYTYSWVVGLWSSCSAIACGTTGTQTRSVQCRRDDGVLVSDSYCLAAARPEASRACSAPACSEPVPEPVPSFAITSGPSADNITKNSAVISWALSDFGTGQVQYGKTSSLASVSTLEPTYKYNSHTQKLSRLSRRTTYYYRVVSKNSKGEVVISPIKSFRTK